VRKLFDRLRDALRSTSPNTRWPAVAALALVAATASAILRHPPPPLVAAVYTAAAFPVVALAFARARFDRFTIAIVLGGLWLYLGYLAYTDFGERNYDGGEQLRYVQYIVEHHARPPASYCLICHHPPLYYAIGAAFYRFFDWSKLGAPVTALQVYGLVCQMIFVGYAVATARALLATRRELHLAAALIVFWPYSVVNSVRVHNDSLASTLMAAAIFYLVRWTQRERRRDLYLTALVTGLGLLTKSSAYAVAGAFVMLLGTRFLESLDRVRFARRGLAAGLVLAAALVLNARGKESPTSKESPFCHKILGNACDINKGQWVDNKPKNYLMIEPRTFFREPYALAERDGSGRAYFWNHLLKSSLFGTHNTVPDKKTSYALNRGIAFAMNDMMLGMLAFMAASGAAFARHRAVRRFGVALVLILSCVAFMVAFRALIPAPHHTDFRHIFPVVTLVAALYAAAAARASTFRPWLGSAGRALAVAFCALSIVYYLPKHDWVMRVTRHVVTVDPAPYGKLVAEGTPWDKAGNLIIEPNEIVDFPIKGQPLVREIDLSFDNNDRYEIQIRGDETRTIVVGPKATKKGGLVRYTERIDPPVANVVAVRVRPVSGDYAYSLGHLILH
jgi:hypothetical protein